MPRNIRQRTKTPVPGIWQTTDDTYVVFARWTCPVTGKRIKKELTTLTLDEAIAVKRRFSPDGKSTSHSDSKTLATPALTTPPTPTVSPTTTESPSVATPTTDTGALGSTSVMTTTPAMTSTLSMTTATTTSTMSPPKTIVAPATTPSKHIAAAAIARRTTPLFVDFAEQWLALQVKRIEPSTTERYTAELAHWVARFAELRLDEVSAPLVREAVAAMADDAARSTVNGRLRLLKQVLQQAVDDGLLDKNAAAVVRSFSVGRTRGPRGTALSPTEFARFVAVTHAMIEDGTLKPDVGRMVLVLAWTGLRMGEVRALRFVDWDEGEQELRIEHAGWRNHVKGTKSDEPRRVAVVEPLRALLLEQRQWLQVTKHPGASSGLMFPGDPDMRGRARALRGRPRRVTPSSKAAASVTGAGRDLAGHRPRGKSAALDIDGTWMKASSTLGVAVKKVVARAGTAVLSPHGFRRTAENLARRAGVDGLVRRAHAGWRSERVQALYATVDPDERRAAGAAVVALVEAAVQPKPAPSSPTTPPVTPTSSAPPDASGSLGSPARAGMPSAPNAPETAAHHEPKPPEPASADAAGVPALVRPALLVRPAHPAGTPEGNPGLPDESLWN